MIMANEPIVPAKDTRELRQETIDTCFYMRDKLAYFVSTWGNISVRVEGGLVVTPSRVNYEELQPEDLPLVSWEGVKLKGERVPTSETELHRQIMLGRPDIGAIIHSHSPWASVCACAHRAIPVLSDDMAEVIGGPVNCAPYVPAGRHKELAAAAREAIGPDATAVLMGNHGVLVGGARFAGGHCRVRLRGEGGNDPDPRRGHRGREADSRGVVARGAPPLSLQIRQGRGFGGGCHGEQE